MKVFLASVSLVVLSLLFTAGVSDSTFDHSAWNALLQKNVSEKGIVNYEAFKADETKLNSYLESLAKLSPSASWSKNETMAYWINAYNAFTIRLILDNYPIKSIMKINGGKAWDLKFIEIGDKKYSLNNIEHDILREKHKDARIHFAVNCASVSCPKLYNKAFSAENLESQLDMMSKSFVNNESKNSISAESVQISQLFNWYKDDFTKNGSVIDFLNKYSSTKITAGASISYKEYNWGLNN